MLVRFRGFKLESRDMVWRAWEQSILCFLLLGETIVRHAY